MIFIGVDPGQSGAVVALSEGGAVIRCVKNDSTERDTFDAFCGYETEDVFAMIERVHSMPKQGVAACFTFGRSYGFLRGCLIGSGVSFEEVTPQKWQRVMGIPSIKGEAKSDHKKRTKARAQQLFPRERVTHANADALLIAEYCRRTKTNTL
jgi:pantothenate kinase